MIYLLISILACVCSLLGWQVIRLERKVNRTAINLKNYADASARSECAVLEPRLRKLEEGVIPNYEEARKAAKAVDDFNIGLSAIMNFDPMAAAKKARDEKSAKGGGVDGV